MKKFLLPLFAIVFSINAYGINNSNNNKLDSLLERLYENQKVMCSVSITEGGKQIYSKSFGYSDIATKSKLNDKTEFRIGSISKIYTAVLIFQLIEEGKLELSTPLAKYFPTIQNSESITIEHLLHHRSGIKNITNAEDYLQWNTKPITQEAMLQKLSQDMPAFEPNEYTEYSNSNFILLGYIVEKITKNSLKSEIQKRIADKIGLKQTYYGGKIDPKLNQALSYEIGDLDWVLHSETDMSVPGGAGAIVSIPAEMNKFITALFELKLVNAASLEKMKEIQDGLGMGLIKYPFYEKYAFGHDGAIDGFRTHLSYFPEEKVSLAICFNGLNYNQNNVLIGILSILFDKKYELPTFVKIDFTNEELIKYEGEYSSEKLPIKITITKTNNGLKAQATGQEEFKLDAKSKLNFEFEQAGVKIEFYKDEKNNISGFTLKQGGGVYKFTK